MAKAIRTMFVIALLIGLLLVVPSKQVHAATAPTVTDYKASNWSDSSSASETTGTLTWNAGDIIVVLGVIENGTLALNTPTATGLTFSLTTSVNSGDIEDAAAYLWVATAGTSGSSAVTSTVSSTGARGIAAYAYGNSDGVGATATMENSTAKTISLNRANANSTAISVMGDWNAVNDTTVTASPAGGTVRQANSVTGAATFFLADWGDQGAAGTTSYGITDHTGTVDMSGIAVEVKGSSSSIEQEGFRFRNDDGSETGATWLAAQDANITRVADTNTRLRTLVNTTSDIPSSQYQLEWRKVGGASDWRKVANTPQTGQAVSSVSTGTDDAQQVGTTMTTTGTTIGASLDATTEWAGMRFQNISVPKGATITSAFLSVVPSGTGEDEPLVSIFAENADNSATFSTGASDISNRSRTSSIAWSSTDLGATGASYHDSPDLSSIIQTVVNRSGWATGNPVTILVQGGSNSTRDLTIESFENTGNNPPRLTINYTYPNPAFELAASANIAASGENTTAQLTAPSGKTTPDFTTGRLQDDENPADAIDTATNNYTELEWSIKAIGSVVTAGEVYEFRVTNNGTPLNTYSVTPQWTIGTANSAPSSPTALSQKKTDDSAITPGNWTNETSIKLTATVTDPNASDTLKICAEIKPVGTAFTSPAGDGDGCSAASVSSGGTASVTISGLSNDTEYHWQIKTKDSVGAYSPWVSYAAEGRGIDFQWAGDGLGDGITITTSTAGVGDTAFNAVGGTGGNAVARASGTHPPRIEFPALTSQAKFLRWSSATLGTHTAYAARLYFELNDYSPSGSNTVLRFQNAGTEVWRVDVAGAPGSPPGEIRLRGASGALLDDSGTLGLATDTVYRFEGVVTGGNVTLKVYEGDSTVPLDTLTGSVGTTVDTLDIGPSTVTTTDTSYTDDIAFANTASEIGLARDFGVDSTAPTGGTVYDGTTVGVDAQFNNNSLSSLSANWDGIDSGASGLERYEYSIGTTAGGTDIKGWTNNLTNTSVTTSSLTLRTSQQYYVNVRAVDNAGNVQTAISSNGQLVLPSLSFGLSTNTIALGSLNTANSYTSTQSSILTTSTNAYGGYVIRAFATDYLRSSANTIPDFNGGTYASPDSWQSGDTGFGYTSNDTSVQGVNRFQSNPCPGGTALAAPGCYAPFSQSIPGDIVADHTANVSGTPVSNEQFTLTYRATAASSQPAASGYTTTIVYTVTPSY